MQLIRPGGVVFAAALIAWAWPGPVGPVLAAGTGRGGRGVTARTRTNVYADNDGNQIITPLVAVDAVVNDLVALSAHAGLDVMTSASIDVISAATPKGYFQETRQEAGGAVTLSRELAKLTLGATGSVENDYSSLSTSIALSDEFAQRNTTLALAYSFTDSNVGRANDPDFERDLNSHTLTASWTQVLGRSWIGRVSAFVGVLNGFQSSVYRHVRFANGASGPEVVPDLRVRNAAAFELRGALGRTFFVAARYRLYRDTWGITSHTGEVSLSHTPTRWLTLRVRDRLYLQSGAPFYASRFERPLRYMSIDRELGAFRGHLVGAKADVLLRELSPGTSVGVDLKIDGMWQTFSDFPLLPVRRYTVVEAGLRLMF